MFRNITDDRNNPRAHYALPQEKGYTGLGKKISLLPLEKNIYSVFQEIRTSSTGLKQSFEWQYSQAQHQAQC